MTGKFDKWGPDPEIECGVWGMGYGGAGVRESEVLRNRW